MLAALAPMKLPRTESPPADKKDTKEDLAPYSPRSSQSRNTIIPSDIATNPLVAMQYLKCTNESQQRYIIFLKLNVKYSLITIFGCKSEIEALIFFH